MQGGEVSIESLQEQLRFAAEDRDHEREERNYFQLERDKINTFWEISKKELEDRKAELRNKDREMEELEERHQVRDSYGLPRACRARGFAARDGDGLPRVTACRARTRACRVIAWRGGRCRLCRFSALSLARR